MSSVKAIRRFHVRTVLPERISALHDLALNLRWSWHPPTRQLFASIDPDVWEDVGHDPAALLSGLSRDRLDQLAQDEAFVARLDEAAANLSTYMTQDRWFQQQVASGADMPSQIAYFSPEFGITHVLPQYSGGLGILAGDHLKAASDLGLPLTGVGLFYKQGYFRQTLSHDGWQQESYPVLDPDDLPLSLLREEDGSTALITVDMPGGSTLHARVWRAQVGRVTLLLMDSDVEQNDHTLRDLTGRLYGGGGDQRLQQEMLLGIGGVRALRLYSRLTGAPTPEVYHSNEGHAGFLGIERISELTREGLSFDEALAAVRAGTVFTTHTPVPAGIDRFGVDQIRLYFGEGGREVLPGVPVDRLIALGAETYPGGSDGVFNMAVMGLRLARRANGVSLLHGEVSREMFRGLWPGLDADEVPIGSITNGVHASTWVDPRVVGLAKEHLGTDDVEAQGAWDRLSEVPAKAIWDTKRELRQQLVEDARARLRRSSLRRGMSEAELGWIDNVLDPNVLTIGFARRVPTYKRLTLMLRDRERLTRLLTDPERPVQLVIAGKSHPADDTGKRLIQEMVQFADEAGVRERIVFLPNYDMAMARLLYPGCDVWLNNPLRPFEACGTSGMKASLNGALNLSIKDGWWDEWFDGENGWAIPTADGIADADRRDDIESAALLDLIEQQVVPRFYDRDADGLPQRWIELIRHTLSTLGPKVLASRMVCDYTQKLYAPAAQSARAASADGFAQAKSVAAYTTKAQQSWHEVRVDHVEADGVSDSPQIGDVVTVRASVSLGALSPDEVSVQVAFGQASDLDELTDVETQDLTLEESYDGGRHQFQGEVTLSRTGSLGYTVRVLPRHEGLVTPVELGLVTVA